MGSKLEWRQLINIKEFSCWCTVAFIAKKPVTVSFVFKNINIIHTDLRKDGVQVVWDDEKNHHFRFLLIDSSSLLNQARIRSFLITWTLLRSQLTLPGSTEYYYSICVVILLWGGTLCSYADATLKLLNF